MRRLVTSLEMGELDSFAQSEYGYPQPVLMENAGRSGWEALAGRLGKDAALVFVAGKGNNGGDALVMARHARASGARKMHVITVGAEETEVCRAQCQMLRSFGIEPVEWKEKRREAERCLEEADVIVDGLLGTGARGVPRSPYDTVIAAVRAARRRGATVCAVDIPSGLGAVFGATDTDGARAAGEQSVEADLTLVMELPKYELLPQPVRHFVGTMVFCSVGFPPPVIEAGPQHVAYLERDDLSVLVPPLSRTAHKGRRGHVAVLAGAPSTAGAAGLVSTGAVRARAGLVSLLCDGEVATRLDLHGDGVMVRTVSRAVQGNAEDILLAGGLVPERIRSAVLGSGWGTDSDRAAVLSAFLRWDRPLVLDADGINLIAADAELRDLTVSRVSPTVLTPHAGEAARLLGDDPYTVVRDPLAAARRIAARFGVVCVVKSSLTAVAEYRGGAAVWDGASPALGVGGSGDVLAGAIGGLLGNGIAAMPAAKGGVLAHGLAGLRAAKQCGYCTPGEIALELGRVFGECTDYAEG